MFHYGCTQGVEQHAAVACAALQYSDGMSVPSPSLTHAALSVRRYQGEYGSHTHGHAQILMGLAGRLELELDGRAAFVDASCGLVIPAGVRHAFVARQAARVSVVDTPDSGAWRRFRRFAITSPIASLDDADAVLQAVVQAPQSLVRRGLDLSRLDAALDAGLHHDWSTANMAALFFLSAQRFHARLTELTGLTPQRYLRQRRLALAMRCLRDGSTLELAALRCGYGSGTALAYALRRDKAVGVLALRC
jgi:AraC-like DNA-binding protein